MQEEPAALLWCVVSVWASWSVHDYLQERVFRAPGFHFGFFMAFVLQASSFVLSAAQSSVSKLCEAHDSASERRKPAFEIEEEEEETETRGSLLRDGPAESHTQRFRTFLWYALLSALIAGANGTATAALNFVNMQVKVLFKSSKIVTVMLIGCAFGRLYRPNEYGCMLLVALGLVTFFLAGSQARLASSLVGVALLVAAVCCDSLIPNVQQKLLQDHQRPKAELVFQ